MQHAGAVLAVKIRGVLLQHAGPLVLGHGVVDDDVGLAKLRRDLVAQGQHGGKVAHVGLRGHGSAAHIADLLRHALGLLPAAVVVDAHVRAAGGQRAADDAAQIAAAAGDDGDFSRKIDIEHVFLPPCDKYPRAARFVRRPG